MDSEMQFFNALRELNSRFTGVNKIITEARKLRGEKFELICSLPSDTDTVKACFK